MISHNTAILLGVLTAVAISIAIIVMLKSEPEIKEAPKKQSERAAAWNKMF